MKLKCLVIEDEPAGRKILQEFIEETEFLEIAGSVSNPVKALQIINKRKIDLIFLDIQMPKMNGIEFLKSLTSPPPVILTTAFSEYAIQGFDLDVVDYLLKPIPYERFLKAVGKVLNAYKKFGSKEASSSNAAHFFVKSGHKFERINFDDLLIAEAANNYVILHTKSRRYVTYLTFKGLSNSLPTDKFIKVHKSFIVAADRIESVDNNGIYIGGKTIPISRGLRDELLNRLVSDKLIKR